MIIVTGASGRLGSKIVDRLLDRVPADTVGVSVRDVNKAAELASRGVRVRAGDFTEPASLDHAFADADQVLVVSAAIRGSGAASANRAAIGAAVRAEQTIAWTSLHHGFYASTLEIFVPTALETGELRLPEDGPFSWTSHADLAEVDAIALTRPGVLDRISPPLTAPEALDFADIARVLSDITGRTITRIVVDDEEWKRAAVARGLPAPAADFTLGMFRAARRGEFAMTDPTLENLLGRPAISVRTAIEKIVAAQ